MERAVIQSSADIRTAESDASICFARVVLPVPGSPQMMNSVAGKSMGSGSENKIPACFWVRRTVYHCSKPSQAVLLGCSGDRTSQCARPKVTMPTASRLRRSEAKASYRVRAFDGDTKLRQTDGVQR